MPSGEDVISNEEATLFIFDNPIPAPKPKEALPPPPKTVEPPKEDAPSQEEIEEAKDEAAAEEKTAPAHVPSMRSDMVNMVVDLFDGKFLD